MKLKYDAYLFDFDYTLADSSKGIIKCFRGVFENHGYTDIPDEEIKRTIGKTLEESFSILTGENGAEILAKYKNEFVSVANREMNKNTVLFPETERVLKELKRHGAKIGIVSTKRCYRIREFLSDYFPDDFFGTIIGGEDIKNPKPAPDGLLLAMEQLGCSKERTLYVGDCEVDALTAIAAGTDFAGITHGVTSAETLRKFPHYKIMGTLEELITFC